MINLQVKKLNELAILPSKGSPQSAGYDLATIEEYTIMPLERKLFKTGLSFAIPQGMYGRIAPRSGLAFKDGIDVLAGVIDEDYRGEIGVVLINFGKTEKKFNIGDKIAQIIFEFYNNIDPQFVNELDQTIRGHGGFGSTTIQIKDPTLKGDTLKVVGNTPNVKNITKDEEPPKKEYESKIDLIDQWKKHGGSAERPPTYETLIKERESKIV